MRESKFTEEQIAYAYGRQRQTLTCWRAATTSGQRAGLLPLETCSPYDMQNMLKMAEE